MTRPQLCAADVCSNPGVRHNNKLIQCYGGCDKNFHWKCIGLTAAASTALKDNPGMFWFCESSKNNSLFRLHRKVGYIYESVEANRILLRRVETNLESKIETCYSMIRNLAKVNSLSSAALKACCSDQNSAPALDLSLRSNGQHDTVSDSAAEANGKRKLGEDSNDEDYNDDDADDVDDDPVPEAPLKRSRNLQNSTPPVGDLADHPTPTLASIVASTSSVTSASTPPAVLPDQPDPAFEDTNPVVATPTPPTGNYASGICPAEAGHDTAPLISGSPPSQYCVTFDDNGDIIQRTYQAPTCIQPTPSEVTETPSSEPTLGNESAMDTSTGLLIDLQTSAGPPECDKLFVL